jgi:ankyrin repeat protein
MPTSVRSFDQITIAAPCDADWASMIGNDQVRFCEHCHLHVNNLSTMTRSEAMQFVARSRGRICIRFVQSPAGGPLTGKMPEKLYNIGRRASRIAAGAFSAALSVASVTAQSSPSIADPASCATAETLKTTPRESVSDDLWGIVAGTIKDTDGGPISEASVFLVDRESGEERSTTTSANGDYSFQGLAGGDYVIWARKPRFETARDTANVHANSRLRIDFEMSAASHFLVMGGAMAAIRTEEHPLVKAVSENDLTTVKTLAFTSPNINSIQTQSGLSLLAEAVSNGNREIVNVLLMAGANVNARTRGGRTALMFVSDKTSVELVRDLLTYGANVNARDDFGDNATIVAAEASTVAVLKELINAGAKIDVTNSSGQSALFGAARHNVEAIELLIKYGVDPNVRDEDGQTALMATASYGEIEVFQKLLDKGAEINLADYEGRTTLMAAAANDDPAIAELLIKLGANIDTQASDGARAALSGDEEIVQVLLDGGADVKIRNNDGQSPLAIAREREDEGIVKLLKSRGAPE